MLTLAHVAVALIASGVAVIALALAAHAALRALGDR